MSALTIVKAGRTTRIWGVLISIIVETGYESRCIAYSGCGVIYDCPRRRYLRCSKDFIIVKLYEALCDILPDEAEPVHIGVYS